MRVRSAQPTPLPTFLCRSAILLGSLVPLGMFLSWEAVALSLLPVGLSEGAATGAGSVLQASLQLAASDVPTIAADLAASSSSSAAMPVATLADGPGMLAVDPLEVSSLCWPRCSLQQLAGCLGPAAAGAALQPSPLPASRSY